MVEIRCDLIPALEALSKRLAKTFFLSHFTGCEELLWEHSCVGEASLSIAIYR